MPEIRVKHNVAGATQPPARPAIPPAIYEALIANVTDGMTTMSPPRMKITIEYQLVKRAEDGNEEFKGRRVYQDYIIEPGGNDMDAREAWRLKQVLDAVKCVYRMEDEQTIFNTDHLIGKYVKIDVRKRIGKLKPEEMALPVEKRPAPPEFNRIDRVDSISVNEDELV